MSSMVWDVKYVMAPSIEQRTMWGGGSQDWRQVLPTTGGSGKSFRWMGVT